MKNMFKDEQGSAMVYALLMFLVVMIIVPSSLMLIGNQSLTNRVYSDSVQSIHYADAGVNYYLWYLNKGIDIEFDDGSGNLVVFDSGDGEFTIDVVTAHDSVHNVVVTGWPKNNPSLLRTIEASISKRTFTQYSYITQNEGSAIFWGTGDIVYGDFHTNGNLLVNGNPIFYGQTTYSGTLSQTGAPNYMKGIKPVPTISFPSNNTELKQWADNDGYTFTGRTLIYLNEDKIHVRNPNHNGGNIDILDIPTNGVIYVDGITTDQLHRRSPNKFDLGQANVFISGTLSGKLTIAAANNIFVTDRDPTNYDYLAAAYTGGIKYKDTSFSFNATTGVTTVSNPDKDMLGLIANNSVWILTHNWPDANTSSVRNVAPPNIQIDAAIFAIRHVFGNESLTSWGDASPIPVGTVTVNGSIIMNTRHAMAMVSGSDYRGYMKSYKHDPRMMYMTPPKFINPTNSGWEIIHWNEN